MLQQLVATLKVPDVFFMGHVSNEELSAFYDVADLFLCASEHEGFCVPLMEAFHKRVPVLAYAATAVPSTMDGGGVLYDTKSPAHVASLMAAILDDEDLVERILASQDAALARLVAQDFDGTLLAFRRRGARGAAGQRPAGVVRLLGSVRAAGTARRGQAVPTVALRALPQPSRRCDRRRSSAGAQPESGDQVRPRRRSACTSGCRPRTRAMPSAIRPGGSATCCARVATSPRSSR